MGGLLQTGRQQMERRRMEMEQKAGKKDAKKAKKGKEPPLD
jgi:hypothetical protein